MTNDAIINGQTVTLSEEQVEAASKFHKSRVPFVLDGKSVKFNLDRNDDRDHQHWLCEDFGWSVEEYENAIRGYIMKGKIQLFTSSRFSRVRISDVSLDHLMQIVAVHDAMFNSKEIKVCNGVSVGEVGTVWPPLEHVVTLKRS